MLNYVINSSESGFLCTSQSIGYIVSQSVKGQKWGQAHLIIFFNSYHHTFILARRNYENFCLSRVSSSFSEQITYPQLRLSCDENAQSFISMISSYLLISNIVKAPSSRTTLLFNFTFQFIKALLALDMLQTHEREQAHLINIIPLFKLRFGQLSDRPLIVLTSWVNVIVTDIKII